MCFSPFLPLAPPPSPFRPSYPARLRRGEVASIVVQKRESSVIGDDPLYQDHDPVRIAQIIKDASSQPAPAAPEKDTGTPSALPAYL